MATIPGAIPGVQYEGYADFVPLAGEALVAAAGAAPVRLPPDWQLSEGFTSTLTAVVDTDGSGTETATAPIIYLRFKRGLQMVDVAVLEINDLNARLYADAILATGQVESVPAGRGFVGGPTAVVDTGTSLVRATYFPGVPGTSLPQGVDARARFFVGQAEEVLKQLQPQ